MGMEVEALLVFSEAYLIGRVPARRLGGDGAAGADAGRLSGAKAGGDVGGGGASDRRAAGCCDLGVGVRAGGAVEPWAVVSSCVRSSPPLPSSKRRGSASAMPMISGLATNARASEAESFARMRAV